MNFRNYAPWSEELVDRVRSLWQVGGFTATEIGKQIGKSRDAVLGKLFRMGLTADGTHLQGSNNGRLSKKVKEVAPPVFSAANTSVENDSSRGRATGAGQSDHSPDVPPPLPILTSIKDAIEKLQEDECHWPLPDGPVKAIGFCGAPAVSRSYCSYHYKLATRPDRGQDY